MCKITKYRNSDGEIFWITFRTTVYIEHSLAWYDLKTQSEILTHKVFSMILEAIGTPGLAGLDKLISHYVTVELKGINDYMEKGVHDKNWTIMLDECRSFIQHPDYVKGTTNNPSRLYAVISGHSSKIWPSMFESIMRIGQFQLFRNKIAYELNTVCKFEAKHMEAALRTLNRYENLHFLRPPLLFATRPFFFFVIFEFSAPFFRNYGKNLSTFRTIKKKPICCASSALDLTGPELAIP